MSSCSNNEKHRALYIDQSREVTKKHPLMVRTGKSLTRGSKNSTALTTRILAMN